MVDSKNRDVWGRRRSLDRLAKLALVTFLPALPACAAPTKVASNSASGVRSYTLPLPKLEALIKKEFPLRKNLSGLMDLALSNPRLRLLPETNRLGTQVDLLATESFMGTQYPGAMDLNYGIRFDGKDGRIRMADVRVDKVEFPAVPAPYRPLFAKNAPRVAEQLLDGLVLHEINPEQLAMVNGLGFRVGEVKVVPEGLRVELLPVLGTK